MDRLLAVGYHLVLGGLDSNYTFIVINITYKKRISRLDKEFTKMCMHER